MHSIQKPAKQVAMSKVEVRWFYWASMVMSLDHDVQPSSFVNLDSFEITCWSLEIQPLISSPFSPSKRDPRVAGTGSPLLHFPTAGYLPPFTTVQTAAVRQGQQELPLHETAITVIALDSW